MLLLIIDITNQQYRTQVPAYKTSGKTTTYFSGRLFSGRLDIETTGVVAAPC